MAKSPSEPAMPSAELKPVQCRTSSGAQQQQQYKCTICTQNFVNLQECLKHELLQHSTSQRPQKSLRQKLNAILNSFKAEGQQPLHTQLRAALQKCEPGQELSTIFKCHRMDDENLTLVYERIYACLKKELQSLQALQIYPFGSFVTGLALRDSDIDLYIEHAADPKLEFKGRVSPRRIVYNRINNILHRSSCFSDVIAIRQARVPIIKCKHTPTGFSLDINLSCPSSVHNTNFLRDLMQFDSRLHELMIFLKIWAKQLQIIGRGNMTSYCLITLVIFYLQQPQRGHPALLPSIKTLQAKVTPNEVVGVNYAYDLHTNMQPLPRELTVLELIRGFFSLYSTFEFEQSLIAPYLGQAISLEQFRSGNVNFPAYNNQLRGMTILNNGPVEPLQTERCMCVQDPFSLNHNVSRSMTPPNLEYFRDCVQHACKIYDDENITTDGRRCEALLYGIVERIAYAADLLAANGQREKSSSATTSDSSNSQNKLHGLNYRFTPGRSELRALAQHTGATDPSALQRLWVEHYTAAVVEIISDIYRLDMQSASPTHGDKHQRLENTGDNRTWMLSGSVDQWTGRLHQRSSGQTFMEVQRAQTEKFQRERRQNANYAVQLNATLTLNVLCNSTAIELIVAPRDSKAVVLNKKDPLRKFFMMFKCSMQNFNLKERLEEQQQ